MNDELLTNGQLCDKLQLCRQTIYTYEQRGMPIAIHTSRSMKRYNLQDCIAWLKNPTDMNMTNEV